MAKSGQTIDQLFLSLGLDTTQLDADFITADKTVSQGIQELSRKQSQAKLRLEIDTSGFAGAENSVEALTSRENGLTNMLKIQKSSVLLVNAAYQESVQAKGADDVKW